MSTDVPRACNEFFTIPYCTFTCLSFLSYFRASSSVLRLFFLLLNMEGQPADGHYLISIFLGQLSKCQYYGIMRLRLDTCINKFHIVFLSFPFLSTFVPLPSLFTVTRYLFGCTFSHALLHRLSLARCDPPASLRSERHR